MKNINTTNIIGITMGIRFSRSFRIPDISGEIIDEVLYHEKSPFGERFFPNIQENSAREKTLHNPETSEYLRLNTDDLILAIKVDNNFEERFNWLKENVILYFKDTLFQKYGIKNIRRLGIIFTHKIEKKENITRKFVPNFQGELQNAKNFHTSFSKKDSAIEALIRKDVNDYKNYIYNMWQLKNKIILDLDCQYYYEPIVEDLRECSAETFLDGANDFLNDNFYGWLNENEAKKNK